MVRSGRFYEGSNLVQLVHQKGAAPHYLHIAVLVERGPVRTISEQTERRAVS